MMVPVPKAVPLPTNVRPPLMVVLPVKALLPLIEFVVWVALPMIPVPDRVSVAPLPARLAEIVELLAENEVPLTVPLPVSEELLTTTAAAPWLLAPMSTLPPLIVTAPNVLLMPKVSVPAAAFVKLEEVNDPPVRATAPVELLTVRPDAVIPVFVRAMVDALVM